MTITAKLAAVALAALCLGALDTPAAGAADAPAAAPYNPKDLSGIWMQQGGAKFMDYAWTPDYQKIADKRKADTAAGDPYQSPGSSCLPRGLSGMLTTEFYPMEVFQTLKEVAIFKENGNIVRIHLDRQHLAPADLTPLFFGDTIGHWEGDELVINSISLGANDNIDGQSPHSDALHVVARFHRTSATTMDVAVTVDDAKALTKPAHAIAHYVASDPAYEIQEYYCVNERNTFAADGQHVAGVAK